MSIGKEFLVENFPLFCIVIGLTFICIQNYTTYRRESRYILVIMAETLLLSVFLVCERYLKNEGNVLGTTIFSYLGYTLRPITLFLFIRLADTRVEKIHWLSVAPLFINAVVYSFCFVPGAKEYLFTYQVLPDGTLQFVRGSILNFFSHFISALYLAYLTYVSIEKLKGKHISQAISILFCAASVIVAVVVESIFFNHDLYLLNASIAVSTLFYYLFLYTERTKCDPLTGLFNRETYTTDLKKLNRYINAIIQLDMNGLKYLNDTFGHQAGDKALVALAGIIEKCSKRNMYIYRLGGDEFIILCLKSNKKQVESVIASIKEKMHETEYFCSIGYAIKEQGEDTLDSLFVASEEKMYEDKKEFYKNHPKYDRRNNS